jgi:phage baseplate assembly protein W
MSDLGKTVDDIKRLGKWKSLTVKRERKPIGIKTPLEKGKEVGESLFKMHFDINDQIKDNLKNLIMTQKGERLGFPDYGTSLRLIYSNTSITDDQIAEIASREIKQAVSKFMPNINLLQFYSEIADVSEFKNDSANNSAVEFLKTQQNVSFAGSSMEDINKNNPNLNSIYKINISYNIPMLNDNQEKSIILYINNSK